MTAACNAPLTHRLKRRSREDADPALAKLMDVRLLLTSLDRASARVRRHATTRLLVVEACITPSTVT
jgi:hypothetical protein